MMLYMETLKALLPAITGLLGVLLGLLAPIITRWLDYHLIRKQRVWEHEYTFLMDAKEASDDLLATAADILLQGALYLASESRIRSRVSKLRTSASLLGKLPAVRKSLESLCGLTQCMLEKSFSFANPVERQAAYEELASAHQRLISEIGDAIDV
jgi:hypothetical protein